MLGTTAESFELASFHQLVQELIDGAVQRNTFTQRELELLLDLQMSRIRRSFRPELLRRYLRAVQEYQERNPVSAPLRLSAFLSWEASRKGSKQSSELGLDETIAPAGLSSKERD